MMSGHKVQLLILYLHNSYLYKIIVSEIFF